MRRTRIILIQSPDGKELDNFNENMKRITDLTKDYMMSLSCSGGNYRYNLKDKLHEIRKTVRRQKKLYRESSTNGSSNCYPLLVIVQNYGYGIYGISENRRR